MNVRPKREHLYAYPYLPTNGTRHIYRRTVHADIPFDDAVRRFKLPELKSVGLYLCCAKCCGMAVRIVHGQKESGGS